jgi:hypothetical protein
LIILALHRPGLRDCGLSADTISSPNWLSDMNDDLMVQALCWEFQAKVAADYASANRDLYYFCPDPTCLREVYAAKIVNRFFRAKEKGHVAGCVHEKASGRSSQTGTFNAPAAQTPPTIYPTFLGALPKPRRKPKPSEAEKMALALAPVTTALKQAGTLDEVVGAWIRMTRDERRQALLTIGSRTQTYDNAFHFLGNSNRSPLQLADRDVIVFGAVEIEVGDRVVFIKSVKRFEIAGTAKRLRFQLPLDAPSAADVEALKGTIATFFWRGAITEFNSGAEIVVRAPKTPVFEGLVIRPGELAP